MTQGSVYMPLVKSQQESRKHPRRSIIWRALVKDKKKNFFTPCIVLDISKEGALIKCIEPFKEGLVYPMMINAVIDHKKYQIYTMAKMSNIVLSQKHYKIGVSFIKIDPEDQSILENFIENIF
ncbi:PilZ domain-containing protein [Spartinivicinus ruber]|uniref:PilZ domain-containing protein n=1 Tax=Spartinivicinus ruber TaxID=2683272 RepID=UPI0013D4A796|nr:PilZ domain-containing protein [Spartinivicinus ruber]